LEKLGMCAITETAGLNDTGTLGDLRVQKSKERFMTADLLLFVSPAHLPPHPKELAFLGWLEEQQLPWFGVGTFSDHLPHPDKASFGGQWIFQDNFKPESALKLIAGMEQLHPKIRREITPVKGLPATTHWIAQDKLAQFGARPRADQRIVRSGKVITAAGVSTGLDLALSVVDEVCGRERAEIIWRSVLMKIRKKIRCYNLKLLINKRVL
jgi:tRNA U34 5-carboxymethylaminomethyl modifying GTPase MnmE/TrmE